MGNPFSGLGKSDKQKMLIFLEDKETDKDKKKKITALKNKFAKNVKIADEMEELFENDPNARQRASTFLETELKKKKSESLSDNDLVDEIIYHHESIKDIFGHDKLTEDEEKWYGQLKLDMREHAKSLAGKSDKEKRKSLSEFFEEKLKELVIKKGGGVKARYQRYGDNYYAYGGGLSDYYYAKSAKLGEYGGNSGRYKRGGAAANFIDFDDYYYDDSDAMSGGLDDDYYYVLVADDYDYDNGGYEAPAQLSGYDDKYYYGHGARSGRYYGSKLKAKRRRNHRGRYGRRGLMDDMEDGGVSVDSAGLILSAILFIGLIALFVMRYRYKMGKEAMNEKHHKMRKQITNDNDREDQV